MKTVAELRRAGYKVQVAHGRILNADGQPLHKGGSTVVSISKQGQVVASGKAECSKKDSFNRKLGLTIALGRALKNSKNSL